MLKHILLTGSLVLALGIPLPARADSVTYTASLAGSNEVPPHAVPGTGTATFVLTGDSLSIDLSYFDLSSPPAAGHIHCCAPVGSNAIVAVPFVGLPSTASGTYMNTVDLALASTYTSAFITASGGTVADAESTLIAGLNSGNAYANLHTSEFPTGEIRGQIAATPELNSLYLLGTGLFGLAETLRRRTRGSI